MVFDAPLAELSPTLSDFVLCIASEVYSLDDGFIFDGKLRLVPYEPNYLDTGNYLTYTAATGPLQGLTGAPVAAFDHFPLTSA